MIATCQQLNKLFLFLFHSTGNPDPAVQERTIVRLQVWTGDLTGGTIVRPVDKKNRGINPRSNPRTITKEIVKLLR